MDNTGGGGGVSTVTLLLKDSVPTDAVTVYEPEEPLPVLNVVLACPLLSVVVLVGLSDTVPSAGLTLNVTVSPGASIPSSWTSRENVVLSPGVRGQIVLNINAKRPAAAPNGIHIQINNARMKLIRCFFIALIPWFSVDGKFRISS